MEEKEKSPREIKKAILALKNQVPIEKRKFAGVEIWVHGMSSYELEEWRLVRNSVGDTDTKLSTAKLLQITMRDAAGNKIFKQNEVAIIGGLPARDVEPIARIALKLSGFGLEAERAALKNLLTISGEDGSSEQPENTNAA